MAYCPGPLATSFLPELLPAAPNRASASVPSAPAAGAWQRVIRSTAAVYTESLPNVPSSLMASSAYSRNVFFHVVAGPSCTGMSSPSAGAAASGSSPDGFSLASSRGLRVVAMSVTLARGEEHHCGSFFTGAGVKVLPSSGVCGQSVRNLVNCRTVLPLVRPV